MSKATGILFTCLGIFLATAAVAMGKTEGATNKAAKAADITAPALPDWQALEFEEKAYWATAKSRLEILPNEEDESLWDLEVVSSVVNNSEQINVSFEPATGLPLTRSRFSRGSGQRIKSYLYEEEHMLRERRDRVANKPPADWPVASSKQLDYPDSMKDIGLTSPYLLILLAQRLQEKGPNKSMEILVHTDKNFYRVRLSSGQGLPVDANYTVPGGDKVSGSRPTLAVAVQFEPEGELADKEDFHLLGLQEDIIIFFDKKSGLPLQISGKAPRIGDTRINLKTVTMRQREP